MYESIFVGSVLRFHGTSHDVKDVRDEAEPQPHALTFWRWNEMKMKLETESKEVA